MATEMTRRRFVRIGATAVGTLVIGGGVIRLATDAPEVDTPSTTMIGDGTMKALVVYATKSGCTTGVAEQIGTTLSEKGVQADVLPAESAPSPEGYDAVIVGSGVRVGTWHESARTWVEANADALKKTPTAFYTCCLTIANGEEKADEVRAYTDPLIESSGVRPVEIGLFAGWFEPKQFSFLERSVLKLMKAPEGDRRDFDAIAKWTEQVAPKLGVG